MTGWTAGNWEKKGVSIHYTRTGGDKPAIVLLHGLMTGGLCWTALARKLEKDYDVIMPDARGHGNSSVPDHGYSYEDHADDVVGLIDALGLRSTILLGHSMGGMTAAVVASRKPKSLRAVVLADPTFLSPQVQREVRDSGVDEQHRQALKLSLEETMADARKRHPRRSEETIELFARARLRTSMAAFDVLTPPNPDFRLLVKSIGVPGLLIFGDRGVVSAALADELHTINPRIRVEQVPDAGHSVQLDQPERFERIVESFLVSILIPD